MANLVYLTFDVSASHDDSGIEISVQLDQQRPQKIKVGKISQQISIAIDDDQEVEHELTIEMSGKTAGHTKLNNDGSIADDVMVYINNETCMLDDINITSILWDKANYWHNHNGSTNFSDHKFYSAMGCNGTVSMKFSTPVYMWLLDNL